MVIRKMLGDQLREAWKLTITEEYPAQLINSERGLQHFFCQHLQREFDAVRAQRRLFIEPCLTAEDGKVRSPDLVICHSQKIIGVVEFKYVPRGRASPTKDLETLGWFLSHPKGLELANDRYRGYGDDSIRRYSLAPDAILCWAGVYARSSAREDASSTKMNVGGRFLGLHAVTAPGITPAISFN